jgi:plasmid maintenance system antidote protein VapI
MGTVDEIVTAARKLSPDQFLRLQRKLDRMERERFETASRQAAVELKAAGITDKEIDQFVTRRRRESRS